MFLNEKQKKMFKSFSWNLYGLRLSDFLKWAPTDEVLKVPFTFKFDLAN